MVWQGAALNTCVIVDNARDFIDKIVIGQDPGRLTQRPLGFSYQFNNVSVPRLEGAPPQCVMPSNQILTAVTVIATYTGPCGTTLCSFSTCIERHAGIR